MKLIRLQRAWEESGSRSALGCGRQRAPDFLVNLLQGGRPALFVTWVARIDDRDGTLFPQSVENSKLALELAIQRSLVEKAEREQYDAPQALERHGVFRDRLGKHAGSHAVRYDVDFLRFALTVADLSDSRECQTQVLLRTVEVELVTEALEV